MPARWHRVGGLLIALASCSRAPPSPGPSPSATSVPALSAASSPMDSPSTQAAPATPSLVFAKREGPMRLIEAAASCVDLQARRPDTCIWMRRHTGTEQMQALQKACDGGDGPACTLAAHGFLWRELPVKAAAMMEKG